MYGKGGGRKITPLLSPIPCTVGYYGGGSAKLNLFHKPLIYVK